MMFLLFFIITASIAGEKEELDYQIAYWQEHIRALQIDYELSQYKLKEMISKKQALEKKIKEETEKQENEKAN